MRKFIDSVRTHVRALDALKQPVTYWDTILIYLLSDKLDYAIRKDWELEIGKGAAEVMPSLEALLEFLTSRAYTLELVEESRSKQDNTRFIAKKPAKQVNVAAITQSHCTYCEGPHHISRCEGFQKLSVIQKKEEVKKRQLCLNCLRKGHYVTSSTSRICFKKHNTMLHMDKKEQAKSTDTTSKVTAIVTNTKESNAINLVEESKQDTNSTELADNSKSHDTYSIRGIYSFYSNGQNLRDGQ